MRRRVTVLDRPFGMKCSGNSFIPNGGGHYFEAHDEYAKAYVVFRKGRFDEHFEQLRRVLSAFKEAGMTLKLSKCVLVMKKCPLLVI